MAKRKSRTTRNKRTQSKPSIWWRLFKIGLFVGCFVAIGVIGYLVYIDRSITGTFEGRRWSVPAQVFALPLELYPKAELSRQALEDELKRLGYRNDADLGTPGTYKRLGPNLEVYLRAFHFMERHRPSSRVVITFEGRQIHELYRYVNGTKEDIPLIRLDPALIGSFFPSHGEDRIVLTPADVPPLLAAGLIAVEDREFEKHAGFSVRGIVRAFLVNLRAGERRQGGSTLTQQLVKSYFLSNRRTFERKLQEVAMAVILELRFSKTDLLTAYINEIFLGQNGSRAIHGFGLGAQFYFNKPINELDSDEIATLIAVIRGPSYYNPFRHEDRALERRNRILATFFEHGLIDDEEHTRVSAKPLGVVASPTSAGAYYPAFMDQVRAELRGNYDIEALSSEGLRIFTTIQPRTQERVQQAVSVTLNRIEQDRRIATGSLQAGALVADTQTGEIRAMVGGRKGRVDGFNRAINATRPVGSLLKPVVYLQALESGYDLASPVEDSPLTLTPPNGEPWSPKNFDDEYRGTIPMYRALADSLNLATVNLGMALGLEAIQNRFAALLGVTPSNQYPSLLLGAESLSPLTMLELYGNFASGGFRTPPKAVIAVLDERGRPLTHHPFAMQQSIQPQHAGQLNRALEIAMAKGTGRSSPFARSGVAGKTGTSNDNRDSWFAGFDNSQVSVVWVGRDDNEITGLTGSSGALRVWSAMMRGAFIDPLIHAPEERLVEVEFSTGMLANADCAEVVAIPVSDPADLRRKRGCRLKRERSEPKRGWFR